MKKGFILALLVVAMVALVLPVSARAPLIRTLPTIIIGDTDPENYNAGPPAKGILRYVEALNLEDSLVVDWNNDESYTSDTFHAYLAYDPTAGTPATTINPFVDGRIIDTLTTTELTAVIATGNVPSTTTEILSWPDNWFVNLFDSTRHSDITDPFNALPATWGKAISTTYTKEVAMKLVCGVTSGTGLAVSAVDSVKDLTVLCQSGGTNETSRTVTGVVDYSFTGTDEGWTWTTAAGYTAPTKTTSGPGTTGIGFIQAAIPTIPAGGNAYYAGWLSPPAIPSTNAENQKVYRATALLENSVADPNDCLGFRLRYFNMGFAHQGFVRNVSTGDPVPGDAVNLPYAGHPFTAKVFWAPRPDLGDMADDEGQAIGWAGSYGDVRRYRLAFEAIGYTGEQGPLTMESIIVESFDRPADVTPMVGWGAAGSIPFNEAAGGFILANSPGASWTEGNATVGANSVLLSLVDGAQDWRYVGRKPDWQPAAFNAQAKPVSNHLYRFSVTLACGDTMAAPCYRVVVNSQIKRGAPYNDENGTPRSITWIDWFAFSDVAGGFKQAGWSPPEQVASGSSPFAPAEAPGSVIDVYVYSHDIAESAGTTIFQPIIDVIDKSLFASSTYWPDAITPMTWSAASWQDLGADY